MGYVGAVAVNQALGGSFDDFPPAIDYFKKLLQNEPIVPKQTSYARVLSGEIPILLDYDFNAYRASTRIRPMWSSSSRRKARSSVPYVMSLVKDAPHEDERQEGARLRAVG